MRKAWPSPSKLLAPRRPAPSKEARQAAGPDPECPYPGSPGLFDITSGEIHVWCASLGAAASADDGLGWPLSLPERERAARLRFERDRRRFIAARTILRKLLGGYLHCNPALVGLCYGPAGKPCIDPVQHPSADIEFNLSHSEDLALYAVTTGCAVGVDVESVREIPDAAELAAGHFTPRELAEFHASTAQEVSVRFLEGWTRKEAALKARGLGLGSEGIADEPKIFSPWTVANLRPAPGYVGALAVAARDCWIACRQWNGECDRRVENELNPAGGKAK
jgi:4'-phosphopantetheinyl transferase